MEFTRRFLLVIALLIASVNLCVANQVWIVEGVQSTLNVREQPSKNSAVVATVSNGDYIDVVDPDIANGWRQISLPDGTIGYVASKYVLQREVEPELSDAEEDAESSNVSILSAVPNIITWYHPLQTWMTKALLGLAFLAWLIMRFGEDKLGLITIVSTILSIGILAYVLYMGLNALWFFDLEKVGGWGWLILHAILFLFVVFVQFLGFYYFLKWMNESYYNSPSTLLGICAIPLLFIGVLITELKYPSLTLWFFVLFCLMQIVQIVILFIKSDWRCAVIYLIDMLATVLLLIPTIILAVIAAVIFVITVFMGIISKMSDNISFNSPTPISMEDETPEYPIKIKDDYGNERELKSDGLGGFVDRQGWKWKKGVNPGEFERND